VTWVRTNVHSLLVVLALDVDLEQVVEISRARDSSSELRGIGCRNTTHAVSLVKAKRILDSLTPTSRRDFRVSTQQTTPTQTPAPVPASAPARELLFVVAVNLHGHHCMLCV
jgi:hypothetical protein